MQNLDNESILLISEGKYSEQELEKIFALKALKENPGILGNAFTFEKLVYVLNGLKPNVMMLEPPTILHIAKAIKFLQNEFLDHKWHPEIKQYIAHVAYEEGWFTLPEILLFAQNELNSLHQNIELDEEQKEIQKLKHLAIEKYLNI
jgi:hypothetical protein